MRHAERSHHNGVEVWLAAQLERVPNAPVSQLLDAVASPDAPETASTLPYTRVCLWQHAGCEVLLMTWTLHQPSAIHDHGGGHGGVFVVRGCLLEERWLDEGQLRGDTDPTRTQHSAGSAFQVGTRVFHRMTSVGTETAQTLHIYHGVSRGMRLPDPAKRCTWHVPATHGAWLPLVASCDGEPWT